MHSFDRQDLPGPQLLSLARGSIEYGLIHGKPLPIDCDGLPRPLAEPGATFTTLRSKGKLRGCCGALEATLPLAVDATRSAFQAAYRDTRFAPVSRNEIEEIRVEISVLSPLESIVVTSETDLLEQLLPGTDGLVIIEDWRRATFLPKVWESLPEPRHFLAQLKAKCGLPEDYWSERMKFFRYHTTSYAELI